MDFDLILYIIVILGSILLSVIKTLKKDEAERQTKKSRSGRPIIVENSNDSGDVRPTRKARVAQPEQKDDYFSYETMSERDFEQTFAKNAEEAKENLFNGSETPKTNLTLSEEDVFKGVVWSEILKRKY